MNLRKEEKSRRYFAMARNVLLPAIAILSAWWLFAPQNDYATKRIRPSDLKGTWTTDSPGYEDRFLWFTDEMITFGRGEAGTDSYFIDEIEFENATEPVLIDVHYSDAASTDYRIRFYYDGRHGGTIWLKNNADVHWKRASRGETP